MARMSGVLVGMTDWATGTLSVESHWNGVRAMHGLGKPSCKQSEMQALIISSIACMIICFCNLNLNYLYHQRCLNLV